ncbi:MAG: DinB family protein [Acidimicrobiales bacterium]
MTAEQCQQCGCGFGFNGDEWSDAAALETLAELPSRWAGAVSSLMSDDVLRRPVAEMWSIAEYVDHVREVLFGMRFLLETAVSQPGTNLGASPEPRFDVDPRPIEVKSALAGIERESTRLRKSISELPAATWESTVILDGMGVDPHWIVRHAVHDATHHLLDVERLREAP